MLLEGGGKFTPLEILGANVVAISNGVNGDFDLSRVGKGNRSFVDPAFVFFGGLRKEGIET